MRRDENICEWQGQQAYSEDAEYLIAEDGSHEDTHGRTQATASDMGRAEDSRAQ